MGVKTHLLVALALTVVGCSNGAVRPQPPAGRYSVVTGVEQHGADDIRLCLGSR